MGREGVADLHSAGVRTTKDTFMAVKKALKVRSSVARSSARDVGDGELLSAESRLLVVRAKGIFTAGEGPFEKRHSNLRAPG